jgi:hypothetical protein
VLEFSGKYEDRFADTHPVDADDTWSSLGWGLALLKCILYHLRERQLSSSCLLKVTLSLLYFDSLNLFSFR